MKKFLSVAIALLLVLNAAYSQCTAIFWMIGVHNGLDTTGATYTFTYPDNQGTGFQAAPASTGTIDENSTFVSSNTAIAFVNTEGFLSLRGVGTCTITATTSGGCVAVCHIIVRRPLVKPDANGIVYVESSGAPTGDGSSWAKAVDSLSFALGAAAANTDIKQIWVAKGTYQPLANQSFAMVPDVKIYGGFAGTETSLSQRNLAAGHTSNLKGNGASVIFNNNSGLSSTAVLDGFVITGGSGSAGSGGGGMNDYSGSPAIANCIFSGNNSAYYGGGVATNNGSSPSFTNCVFSENTAIAGGVWVSGGSSIFTNCIFSGNSVSESGGGVFSTGSPHFINCIFSGNAAAFGGGVFNGISSASAFTNCTFSGNNATSGNGGTIMNDFMAYSATVVNCIAYGNSSGIDGSGATVTYSLVQGWTGGGTGNRDNTLEPLFVNAPNASTAPFTGGDYQLQVISPAINKGSNAVLPADDTADLSGNPRIVGTSVDMGAYENQYPVSPDVTGILYVDSSNVNNAAADGSSWGKALPRLSDAIAVANDNVAVKEIHIARGTYYPTSVQTATDRESSFAIFRGGLKIYGGYATGGGVRNIAANITRLDGNIGDMATNEDNSYHVMVIADITATDSVIIDGLHVSNGNANVTSTSVLNGQDVYNMCGGGIFTRANSISLLIRHCIIEHNNGGGWYNRESSPIVMNSVFFNNSNTYAGGGMSNISGSPLVINTDFIGNHASSGGGWFSNTEGDSIAKLYNCIFWDNKNNNDYSGTTDIGDNGYPATIEMQHCLTQGYGSNFPGNIVNKDPQLTNAATGDFRLLAGSPAINKGSNALLSANDTTDLAGNPRLVGDTVDIGAFEAQSLAQEVYFNTLSAKAYGDEDFVLAATSNSGMPVSFSSAGQAKDSVYQYQGQWYVKIKAAGEVKIAAFLAAAAPYLAADTVWQTLRVSKRILAITADQGQSKIYGNADPQRFTYSISGLVAGDTLTGHLSRTAGEAAGTYDIEQNDLSAEDNYNIQYTGADFTIKKRMVSIAADNQSAVYGEAIPPLTYSITSGSLVSGDAFTGGLIRDAGNNAGTYKIGQGDLALSDNYELSYQEGDLTIKKKTLLVKAEDKTRPYGEANPAFTLAYDGFVPGENSGVITIPAVSTTAVATSSLGDYAIVPSGGSAANYSFEYQKGVLKVVGANLSITKEPKDTALCSTGNATFSVGAEKTSSLVTIAYQWQQSDNGSNWNNINGATSAALQVNAATGKYYRCAVSVTGTEKYSGTARLTVYELPQLSINIPDNIPLEDKTVALAANISGGTFIGEGVSGTTWDISHLSAGSHTISYSYTNANGCQSITEKNVNLTIGRPNIIVPQIEVYPVPTHGQFTVHMLSRYTTPPATWQIVVYSITGQRVLARSIAPKDGWNNFRLDISNVPSGTYVVTVYRNNISVATKKIIKQ